MGARGVIRDSMSVLDILLEPLSHCVDAERIVAMQVAESVHERMAYLAERANEGILTGEEQDEYDALISATSFLSILKMKARRKLG